MLTNAVCGSVLEVQLVFVVEARTKLIVVLGGNLCQAFLRRIM